jgi:hypothetical protein
VVVGARRRATRRAFFRGAGITFVAGAAGIVAACGDDDGVTPAKTGPADVDVLNSLLDLEYTEVAAWRAGEPLLRDAALAAAHRFIEQDREHAAALRRAIRQLGGTPNRPRAKYDIPDLEDQRGFLNFANDLENTAVATYIDALPKLTDPELRGLAAAIVTNEAERICVILASLGRNRLPQAFVTGQLAGDAP